MHIRYLGTGAAEGFPAIFCQCEACQEARVSGGRNVRRRTSMLIDNELLIDLSPDLLAAATEWKLNMGALKYLVVTHAHADHFYAEELANLRHPYSLSSDQYKLMIYGSEEVRKRLTVCLGRGEVSRLEDHFEYVTLSLFTPTEVGPYVITPLKARHCPGAYIYLIQKGDKTLLYANDTGFFPEETWDYLDGRPIDMVSMDCTNPVHSDTPNHMTLEDNVTVKRRLYQLKCATARTRYWATHFSHTAGLLHRALEERMRLYGIGVAYDGMEVDMSD